MTDRNDGKLAESWVRDSLKALRAHHKSAFLRLYDTTSAGANGNFIPEQPADFLVCREGQTYLIEVKSSKVKAGLTKDMLKRQRGHLKIWERAGAVNYVLFFDLNTEWVHVWPGNVSILGIKDTEMILKQPRTGLDAILTFLTVPT